MTVPDPAAFVHQATERAQADFEAWKKSGAPGAHGISRTKRRQLERRGDPEQPWASALAELTRLGARAESVVLATSSADLFAKYEGTVRFLVLARMWLERNLEERRPLAWLLVDEGAKVADDLQAAIARAEAA